MTVSSTHQMNVFLICILAGAICAMVFDFERSIRKIYGSKKVGVVIEDAFFAAICAMILIAAGYWFNNGEIRYYQILAAVCGALFYASFFSRFFMKLFCCMHKVFIRIILKPIFLVCKKTMQVLKRIFTFISKFLRRNIRKFLKIIKKISTNKKRLKKRIKML